MIKYFNKIRTITLFLIICLIQGCSQNQSLQNNSLVHTQKRKYAYPEPLYLKDSPCEKLYVEIDSIEGTNVLDAYIDTIKSFLGSCCSKSKGIEIALNEPFKIKYKNLPIAYNSVLCIDGPENDNNNTAYLHIVFYDSSLELVYNKKNPHVMDNFPTTVFFNVSYMKNDLEAQLHALKHELGHVLGLCKNPTHGNGIHCKNNCLMRGWVDDGLSTPLLKLIGLSNKGADLCEDCLVDIELIKSEPNISYLHFTGPFFVRNENDYTIASTLLTFIIIPSIYVYEFNVDQQRIISQLKSHIEKNVDYLTDEKQIKAMKNNEMKIFLAFYHPDSGLNFDYSKYQDLLEKIKDDPCEDIRTIAHIVSQQKNKNSSNN